MLVTRMQYNKNAWLLLAFLALPCSVLAELDAVQSSMLKPYDRGLRWNNVEATPIWLRGVKPVFEKALRQHIITLAAGDWVEVRVEKNKMLRMVQMAPHLAESAALDDLQVMRSNGTGLYVEAARQRTQDNHQVLFNNNATYPVTYRITNKNPTEQKLALFTSRNNDLGVLAPYRQQIDLSPTAESVALKIGNEAVAQQYWHLPAAQPIATEVTGPRRLTLEGRVIYPATESARAQRWQTSFWIDNQLQHTSSTESNVEVLQTVVVNDKSAVVTRQEQLYVEVPAGKHMLRIQTSVAMYARLLQQDSTDYLFPTLNQPLQTAEVARSTINAQNEAQDLWQLSNNQLKDVANDVSKTNLSNTVLSITEVEKAAQRLASDNQWRDGGGVGIALMNAAALKSPEDTALSRRAETFAGAHTFYRDILPNQKVAGADMDFRWYRMPHLSAIGKEGRNLVIAAQHNEQLLKQLGSGFFMPLPNALAVTPLANVPTASATQVNEKMSELIYFEGFSDKLLPAAKTQLTLLARLWLARGVGTLYVNGHTASNRHSAYTQNLSDRRANAALQFLTGLGVKAAIIQAIGRGVSSPVATNNTRGGRQLNRRVELTFSLQSTVTPVTAILKNASYHLPQRFAPGQLRIAAYSQNAADFFIQIDEQVPQRLHVHLSDRLPLEQFGPTAADAGLLLLAQQQDVALKGDVLAEGDIDQDRLTQQETVHHISTQSAAFARTQTAAPMVTVGVIEIPLTANAKVVRLWREGDADASLRVALQYSADKGVELSEQDFLSIYDIAHDTGESLRTQVRNHLNTALTQDGNAQNIRLLATQWRPLLRLINSERNALYANTIAPQPLATISSKVIEKEILAAKAAENGSQWLKALQHWSNAFYNANNVKTRNEAQWGRIHALHQLGEDFAYEQMLKQILLYDVNQAQRLRALQTLDQHYRASDDEEALLRLYAIAVCQLDDMQHWVQLTTHLLNQGEYNLALLAGLALPPAQRPTELLLRATWQLSFWDTFEQLRHTLKSPQKQAFWAAMHAVALGQHAQALNHLKQAESEGAPYNAPFAEYIEQGLNLKQTFDASAFNNTALPKESVEKWRAWQAKAPGAKVWRDAPEMVKDFAGALPGYAVDRNLHFSYYRATANRPLTLEIMAPAKLRLEVRPIHASVTAPPLEGWISALSGAGQSSRSKWITPIIANQATEGLTISDGTIIGRKIMLELPLTMTGRQLITIDAGLIPIAVKVEMEQAELPLSMVQSPTISTVATNEQPDGLVEQVKFKQLTAENLNDLACDRCIVLHGTKLDLTRKTSQQQPARFANALLNKLDVDQYSARFRIMEMTSAKAALPQMSAETIVALNQPSNTLAQQLAHNQYLLMLNNISVNQQQAEIARQSMTTLLWIAEHDTTLYGRALAAGEALANNNKNVTGIDRILGRLNRNSRWTAIEAIAESPGVRMLPVSGWQPENPAARLQQALLPPLGNDEQIIGGNSRLVLSMVNTTTSTIEIDLSAEDLSLQAPQRMEVVMQRKGFPDEIFVLLPANIAQHRSLRLAEGRQTIRFFIRNALTHQLLRLRFKERNSQPIANTVERMYHAATHQEPLRLQISGPAWLRVDALQDNNIQSRYEYLPKSVQTVELKPEVGHDEALYRLYLRTQAPPQPVVPPRYIATASTPVPQPLVNVRDITSTSLVTFDDGFPLGGQEDGTWTLSAEPWLRYDADSKNSERYLETSLAHRYFDAVQNSYFYSQGLVRLRDRGAAVLGAKMRVDHMPANLPFNVFAEASAYSQTLPLLGNHWSANLKAGINQRRDINPKTWHLPSLKVFAHKVGKPDASSPETVDQDVYTRYKSQHAWGYELADQLNYRPWLDTMLKAGASLSSNENLMTPDKLRINVEWQQQLGQWRADTHVSNNYYFKDADRNKAANIAEFGISLHRDYWLENQNRLELILNLNKRLDLGQNLGWLGLRWHFSNGRAYRDFRPSELEFDDLLMRNVDNTVNNHVDSIVSP